VWHDAGERKTFPRRHFATYSTDTLSDAHYQDLGVTGGAV